MVALRDLPTNIDNRFVDVIQERCEGDASDKKCLSFIQEGNPEYITYKEFHCLINKASNIFSTELKDVVKVNDSGYMAVGYLSQSNPYCLVNHFGLMNLNLTPVILSPRNSVEILIHLLNQSQSKVLIYGKEMESVALQCQKERSDLKLIPRFEPNQKRLVFDGKVQPLLNLDSNKVKRHIALVLHSSGSTDLPKLIKVTNFYMATFLKRNRLSAGAELFYGAQLQLSPLFHIFGLSITWSFLNNNSSIAFPSSPNLHPKQILQDIEYYRPSIVAILPYLIKQLSEYCKCNNSSWGILNKINALLFGGAVLPNDVANLLSENKVSLMNGYGSSETCVLAHSNTRNDYLNLHLIPDIKYELINKENDICQIKILASDPGLALDIADKNGYIIQDKIQIIHHNPKSNELEFRILGRVDDTIIHISGEKTNPIPMEGIISSCPLVKSAVIVGSGKLNNSLLIQLDETEASSYSVMEIPNIIYSYIEKANSSCPSHSRIDWNLVYILPMYPDKPLPATAKGNINRKKANLDFEMEIEDLYSKFTAAPISK